MRQNLPSLISQVPAMDSSLPLSIFARPSRCRLRPRQARPCSPCHRHPASTSGIGGQGGKFVVGHRCAVLRSAPWTVGKGEKDSRKQAVQQIYALLRARDPDIGARPRRVPAASHHVKSSGSRGSPAVAGRSAPRNSALTGSSAPCGPSPRPGGPPARRNRDVRPAGPLLRDRRRTDIGRDLGRARRNHE